MSARKYAGWFFQASVGFEVESYLRKYDYIYWSAPRYQRDFRLGDPVFLWRSKGASRRGDYGAIAFGEVVELPVPKEQVKRPKNMGDNLWNGDTKDIDAPKVGIQIDSSNVKLDVRSGMLLADDLKQIEEVQNTLILRVPIGTVFGITQEEVSKLMDLWSAEKVSLDPTDADPSDEYFEGRIYKTIHYKQERNHKLVQDAKRQFQRKHGRLFCEICTFDFERKYGEIGRDFIEAHHVVPVSSLKKNSTTRIEDLRMLCPNCHRMVHRLPSKTLWDDVRRTLSKVNP